MSLVVPFDGSELSKTALVRAAQFDTVLDQSVEVVSVVPRNNATYARDRGWLGPDDPFDGEAVVSAIRAMVDEIAPEATFHHISVGRHAPAGTIATRIRNFARDRGASIVFVGSENAGRIASSISVGASVSADRSYDTMIVSNAGPTTIEDLEAAVSTEDAIE
ncbi:universal stress protein [Halohasta salina]|uniref:universal stress protein n=1 Tax=Halohasta salina TaxID=2961621 RepID=UPI0020A4E3D0|nr:universal stress protein [Halohasta salina]